MICVYSSGFSPTVRPAQSLELCTFSRAEVREHNALFVIETHQSERESSFTPTLMDSFALWFPLLPVCHRTDWETVETKLMIIF